MADSIGDYQVGAGEGNRTLVFAAPILKQIIKGFANISFKFAHILKNLVSAVQPPKDRSSEPDFVRLYLLPLVLPDIWPKIGVIRHRRQTWPERIIQTIVTKAGINLGVVRGKGIRHFSKRTSHSLRHSFNSVLASAGITEEVRMKLTGHSTKVMNQNYTHLQTATFKNAMSSMPLLRAKPNFQSL